MKLADWRKSAGLTLEFVADAVGVSAMSISRIEKGVQRPSPELAEQIEAITQGRVSAASLVGLTSSKKSKRNFREDAEFFDAGERVTISIAIPTEMAANLKKSGVDLEEIGRKGAEQAIIEANARLWREANAEAIEASNRWIEKHGTLAEQLGLI